VAHFNPPRDTNEYQNILLKQSEDRTFGLLSIFNRKKSAAELIEELNEVLITIDKKIILLLEDLDRNSNDNRLFAEIGSFLDICKMQSNIYFIVPIAELENTKVITRCCKYYHRFLDISPICHDKIIALRDEMLAKIKETTIPVPESCPSDNSTDILFANSNLAELINTPRKMNSIKYFIENQYTPLIGEIEFDDFMIITFLRECKENVRNSQKSGYDFLLEMLPHMQKNINYHKESFSSNALDSSKVDINKVIKDIKKEMTEANVPKNQQDLILFLINGAAKHQKGQRLLCNEYTNYWLYSWTGQFNIKGKIIEEPKLSDQIILGKIEEINNNTCDIDKFIKWLDECDLIYHKFRQFYHRLELSNTFLLITKKFIMDTEKSRPSDLNEISKIFLERVACESIDIQIDNGRKLESWWHEVLRDTLLNAPNKVRPITDIILSNTQPDDIKSKQIYAMIAEELKDICNDTKDKLIKILSGKPYKTLKDITFDHNNVDISRTQTPRDDTWYFLGDWLLNNVDKAPKLLIGNIIYLTASFGEGVFIPYQYLPYFWNKPTKLMKLFVDKKYDITFDDDEMLQKAYPLLKINAKTMLDEFPNCGDSEFYLLLRNKKNPEAIYWRLFDNNDGKKINRKIDEFSEVNFPDAQEISSTEHKGITSESTCTEDGAENLIQDELPKDDEP